MHQKPKIQHGEGIGRGTAGDPSNIKQGTPVMQPRKEIEVENSLQLSFGVKATNNTITKEDHSQAFMQDYSNDHGTDVSILKQKQIDMQEERKQQSGMQANQAMVQEHE